MRNSQLSPLAGEMPPAYAGAGSGRGGSAVQDPYLVVVSRPPPLSLRDISPRKGGRGESQATYLSLAVGGQNLS